MKERIESGFASVKFDNFGNKQTIYSHLVTEPLPAGTKLTFFTTITDDEKGLRVAAYRDDLNDFDEKEQVRRKEFLQKVKDAPTKRPAAQAAAPKVEVKKSDGPPKTAALPTFNDDDFL